jgi:hypothetical protein
MFVEARNEVLSYVLERDFGSMKVNQLVALVQLDPGGADANKAGSRGAAKREEGLGGPRQSMINGLTDAQLFFFMLPNAFCLCASKGVHYLRPAPIRVYL